MVKYDNAASHVTYRDTNYQLAQFHFHAPSEHTIDGQAADMELHLVHADAGGRLLVVGFMIHADEREEAEEEERRKRGVTESNSALDFLNAMLWSHLPTANTFHTQSTAPSSSPSSPSSSSPLLYHLSHALSPATNPLFYHYPGSLTTPPCTEGVQWFVHTSPLHISKSQLSAYTALFPHTSRPVQELWGREVVVVGGVAVEESGGGGVGGLEVGLFFGVVVVAVLVVWYCQRSHAHHTLGEMLEESVHENVVRDKQADAQWRRDREATAAANSTARSEPDDDARPLLASDASTTSASVVPASNTPVGKVMRRSTGSRASSNGNLVGAYKGGEEAKGGVGLDEPRESPKSSPRITLRR